MVNELIERGYEGAGLLSEVMRLTGLPSNDAAALIAMETGKTGGDAGKTGGDVSEILGR